MPGKIKPQGLKAGISEFSSPDKDSIVMFGDIDGSL